MYPIGTLSCAARCVVELPYQALYQGNILRLYAGLRVQLLLAQEPATNSKRGC